VVNVNGKEAQPLSLVISACSYWKPRQSSLSIAPPQNGKRQKTKMSKEAADSSLVKTPNSSVAPEDANAGTVSSEDEEKIVAMKPLKSTKEGIQETAIGDLHSDNDNVSFLLEEPRSSLKKGFNIEVRSVHTVSPLQTQIAGHGSENDGQRGLLVHESGFVLKPVQAPPKGTREVAFYQSINSSDDEVDQQLVQLTARFYGTQAVKVQNGVVGLSDYLVLENLTQGLGAPCVMDVKIGARTYGPDASESKKKQEDAKYQGTKVPFGFSVLGIISHNKEGVKRLNKAFGRSLPAKTFTKCSLTSSDLTLSSRFWLPKFSWRNWRSLLSSLAVRGITICMPAVCSLSMTLLPSKKAIWRTSRAPSG